MLKNWDRHLAAAVSLGFRGMALGASPIFQRPADPMEETTEPPIGCAGRLGLRASLLAAFLVVALVLPGCWGKHKLDSKPARAEAETVRIAIVGDPALAEAIGRLKAEWHAVTGNTMEVGEFDNLPTADADAHSLGVATMHDALVIPASELGTLVEADRLMAVPRDVRDSPQAAWADMFLLVQQGAFWADDVWAVPLGAPQLTLLYRRDLFEQFHRTPPTTWAEYQTLVQFFSERDKPAESKPGDDAPPADAAWYGTLEPLSGGWGARLLLARAAAYAKHRDNYSTLFDIESFKPLVAGPPFVRALEELLAAQRGAKPADRPQLDVVGVREAFFAGQSAMALTWPSAAGKGEPVDVKVGFAELPGAAKMFNFSSQRWDDRTADESVHVPVVPLEGRMGVVVKGSPHAAAALDLLTWLAGEKWGTRVASASAATTLYRRSQQKDAAAWVEPGIDRGPAREYAQVVGEAGGRSVWVAALRIPGWDEYYAALDEAVERAVRGEAKPAEALEAAAERWASISERLGVDRQRAAYRRSLGLEP
jgi:ABC-type glycerol-3-phosphate transport system substrate-binding protein